MNKKVWYEVYVSDEAGSRTIAICNTYDEAKKIKDINDLGKTDWKDKLHIDKWRNIENPERIIGIE
jgi:hypothetical protein